MRLLLGAAIALVVPAASAQSAGAIDSTGVEHIVSFQARATIASSGTVSIVEVITYDFGLSAHHGIYRYIPVASDWTGKKPEQDLDYDRVTPIDDVTVVSTTAPDDVEESEENGNLVLKIGDPDETVTGVHTYVISYTMEGAFNEFDDHIEFAWNVTGTGWTVGNSATTALVDAPSSVDQVICYSGAQGSKTACTSATASGSSVDVEQGELSGGEGVTVYVSLPLGSVSNTDPILEPKWTPQRAFMIRRWTLAGGAALLAAGVGSVVLLVMRVGRDRRFVGSAVDAAFGNESGDDGPVPLWQRSNHPVEFTPPDNIRPGHVGTLFDEVANPLDVSAMIVDLAVRGYLRIEEVDPPKEGWLGIGRSHGDYRFVRVKADDPELLSAERLLLSSLFRDGDTAVLSQLRQHFAARLQLVEGALYDDVVSAGWFRTRPDRVRARWHGIGIALLILGGLVAAAAIAFTRLGVIAAPLVVPGFLLIVLADRFPSRTAAGTAMYGRVLGFRELFAAGEGERQRFLEDASVFSRYLPYAIVFGMAERWAETFEQLGFTSEQLGVGGWYISPYGYTPMHFGYAMASFSTVTTGSIAAAAPSSSGGGSGFGGGGFSGGGFGGGGGGSW